MELHERLSTARPIISTDGRDPFAEVKNRIHFAVIGDLGPQLFNESIEPFALRDRVTAEIATHLGEEAGISKDDRDRIAAEIADDILGHGPLDFLQRCVLAELNVLISGGTGSGKTTLLNALSQAISDSERIVTIEDAAELALKQNHVLRLESRPKNIEGQGEVTIRELVRNALRMRPDRIIVGEVRGAESLDMLQAMNTGHDGSLTTVHANSPRDALARVETMVLMAGYDLPLRAIRQQIASALDLVIHLERLEDGTRRVTSISEITGMEGDVITMQEIFEFKVERVTPERVVIGELDATGLRPTFLYKFDKRGVSLPVDLFNASTPTGLAEFQR